MPCCFPTCRSITYLLADGTRTTGFRRGADPAAAQVEDYLDYVTNRVMPDMRVRDGAGEAVDRVGVHGHRDDQRTAHRAAAALDCADPAASTCPRRCESLTDTAFMIVIQDFQDPYTLNVKQLMKCCVEEITPDGRLIPFCAYNSVGYREQVRAAAHRRERRRRGAQRDRAAAGAAHSPYGSKIAATGDGDRAAIAPDATNVGKAVR